MMTMEQFVADLAAGASNGIAKGASVYAIDAAKHEADKGTYPHVTLDMYQQLKNHGVTIYNQSFGIDGVVTDFTSIPTSSRYYGYQIGNDILNFYKNEVIMVHYLYGLQETTHLINNLLLKEDCHILKTAFKKDG